MYTNYDLHFFLFYWTKVLIQYKYFVLLKSTGKLIFVHLPNSIIIISSITDPKLQGYSFYDNLIKEVSPTTYLWIEQGMQIKV